MKTLSIKSVFAAMMLLILSACVTDPQPDIPLDAVVTYETVRLEYADEEDPNSAMFDDSKYGTIHAPLVGDTSDIRRHVTSTIGGTNLLLFSSLFSIDLLTRFPASEHDVTAGTWTWQGDDEGIRTRFNLLTLIPGTEGPRYGYSLQRNMLSGDTTALETFSGEFESVPESIADNRVRTGQGVIRYDFDNSEVFDPGTTTGRAELAFRSRGGVRQVRVNLREVQGGGWPTALTAVYQYVQLPDRSGEFEFVTEADFMLDGAPLETIVVLATWLPTGEGRSLAVVSGGSLTEPEALVEECWDAAGVTQWIGSTPDLPGVTDGVETDCSAALQGLVLERPMALMPGAGDPEIPGPHPAEMP